MNINSLETFLDNPCDTSSGVIEVFIENLPSSSKPLGLFSLSHLLAFQFAKSMYLKEY